MSIGDIVTQAEYCRRLEEFVKTINEQIVEDIKISHMYLPQNAVRVIPLLRLEKTEYCPHCGKEIHEKSLYYDGSNWYHRPCMESGPIVFDRDESDGGLFNG